MPEFIASDVLLSLVGVLVGLVFGFLLVQKRRVESENIALRTEKDAMQLRFQELDLRMRFAQEEIESQHLSEKFLREQLLEHTERYSRAEEKAALCHSLSKELEQLKNLLHEAEEDKSQLLQQRVQLETTLQQERISVGQKLAFAEESRRQLSDAFQSLSGEIFRSNSEQFLQLAEQSFLKQFQVAHSDGEKRKQEWDLVVKPIEETLKGVDLKLMELEKARTTAYSSLIEQLKFQQEAIASLKGETSSLVHALKSSTVRGSWCEIQLRRVVELAGMLAYCDFFEQSSVGSEGGRLRPDLVVKLPNERHIVVDAKAPLKAFLEALEASDDHIKKLKFAEHARQLKSHVQQLAGKSYWEQFQPSPEFVVLFLPGDVFYNAAMEHAPDLMEYSVERKVILATPTTLIALLKAIAYGWKQEQMAVSAKAISDLGRELHERVSLLAQHYLELGKNLEKTVRSYNQTIGNIEGRVLISARKLAELGASSGKEVERLEHLEVLIREPRALTDEISSNIS